MSSFNRHFLQYFAGLTFSLVITLTIYYLVVSKTISQPKTVLLVIIGMAVLQAAVQLVLFLHLAERGLSRRYMRWAFNFMIAILLIIVVGSVWIMYHLNYNMMQMTPEQKDYYMTSQKDKGF